MVQKVECNTIDRGWKKAFEVFLNGLVKQDVKSEDDFQEIYEVYNKKFQEKMAGRSLDELLKNATEHLSKQGRHHKWTTGKPEDQLKDFNKEGFEKLLKYRPEIGKVWKNRHTEESKMFLPENSALAANEQKLADIALEVYEKFQDEYDADLDGDAMVPVGPTIDECAQEVLQKYPDIGEDQQSLVHLAAEEFNDLGSHYYRPTKDQKVLDIVDQMQSQKHQSKAALDESDLDQWLNESDIIDGTESEAELEALANVIVSEM